MSPDKAKKRKLNATLSAKEKYDIVKTSEDIQILLANLRHVHPILQYAHAPPPATPPSDDAVSTGIAPPSLSNPYTSAESSLLSKLLWPLSPDSFMSSCFRQKAVHVQSNNTERTKKLSDEYLFGLDSLKIFEETSSDNIFLWITPKAEPVAAVDENSHQKQNGNESATICGQDSPPALHSVELADPQMANLLHTTSHHASYCRAPPELEQPLVSSLLRDTGLGCGQYDPTGDKLMTLGRGEVETFIGTKGHVTDWHFDFQENFTIQLSGVKKWTLRQGRIRHPLRGATPHYHSGNDVIENQIKVGRLSNPAFEFGKQELEGNAFGEEVVIYVKAGDVFYHPAGMWHKVETIEYGVSINASLMGVNYASMVCKALEHVLVKEEKWREIVCNGIVDGERAIDKLDSLLKSLPDTITKNFCNDGGSHSILPPVLRHPPVFQSIGDDNMSCVGDGGIEGFEERNFVNEQREDLEDKDDEAESSTNSISNEVIEIVDFNDFRGPEGWDSERPSISHMLSRSPLATLTKMTDVTTFFQKTQFSESNGNLFILNVNYGGNEMNESSVRIILRDDSTGNILHRCCNLEKKGEDIIELIDESNPPKVLLYYGYLVWIKNGSI